MGERSIAMKELVHHNSKGPNIRFRPVFILEKALGAHINGTSNADVFEAGFIFYCKSEVSYFAVSIRIQKNIGNFDISMNNALRSQIQQSFVNIVDKSCDFPFLEPFLFLEKFVKITLLTVLSNNVVII